jgi:hypothetical protein
MPEGAGGYFGFNSSTTKNHEWIDPRTSGAQWANWNGAQQITPTYTPTSAAQIANYYSPYSSQVVDQSLGALNRSRQMAVNQIADQAVAGHAFGGSRHGVADALTNQGYMEQAGQMAAQLYNQDYAQALAAAQQENQLAYQYPLQRQATLNETLGQITPEKFSKGKTSGFQFGVNGIGGQRLSGLFGKV